MHRYCIMNGKSCINHKATVVNVADRRVRVRLHAEPLSDCSGCAISSICNGSADAVCVDAVVSDDIDRTLLVPGTVVEVGTAPATPKHAVILLLTIPLAAMLAGAFLLAEFGFSEAVCAFGALLSAFAVYVIIALINRKKKPVWAITKI